MAAWDDAVDGARPGVMIVANVPGQKEFDSAKAEALAALGYVGFACDVYGQGKRTTRESDRPTRYMDELEADRALLRDRLHARVAALHALPEVDAAKTAAIGFRFGGKNMIDLARSDGDVLGVVVSTASSIGRTMRMSRRSRRSSWCVTAGTIRWRRPTALSRWATC